MMNDETTLQGWALFITGILILCITFMFGMGALYSKYNVWSSGLAGQAELNQADWNRQIKVREAQALNDSAALISESKIKIAKGEAQAEVERAKGVAEANRIIGGSLKGNEDYLRYLWITGLHQQNSQVIYVPTEANLPILEASRMKHDRP